MFQTGRFLPGGSRVLRRISAAEGGVLHLPTHTPGGPSRETNPEERQGPRLCCSVSACSPPLVATTAGAAATRPAAVPARRPAEAARARLQQQLIARRPAARSPSALSSGRSASTRSPSARTRRGNAVDDHEPDDDRALVHDQRRQLQGTSLLAEEPTLDNGGITQDPFTITFKINPDAVWDDGSPITSKDFDFTWHVDARHRGFAEHDWLRPDRLDRHAAIPRPPW